MNFKADWSFLEKISMGAVSSREVVKMLNEAGHEVIELERYSTSNKIWATKIKRLRLPDLICLKCGRRIESRAKSDLNIRMSDNANNPSRRWDAGLRDEDLIAFIKCEKAEDGWLPGSQVNLFETMSLRETVYSSRLGKPKSPGEGAERDRIWSSSIPKKNGKVIDVIESDERLQIKVQYDNGKNYTYSKKREEGFHAYCKPGDVFCANEVMIAGIPTKKEKIDTCQGQTLMDRIIKRGDIYYAELNPVIGSEQGSTRPVLIISNNTGNRLSPTVIITAITSRSKTRKSKLAHMGDSTGIQMKQSADFARSRLNLPEDYCFLEEDKGLSGYYADRPDFQRMLHDIEAGKIRAVVCYKLDRIS